MTRRTASLLVLALTLASCSDGAAPELAGQLSAAPPEAAPPRPSEPVEGEAVHHFTTAVVHSREPTATGFVQRSTEIIRLSGDLEGYILYHPTTVMDQEAGILVNTGTQLFSGTVLGSEPLLLHDDRFRFEVELETGATRGEVHLGRSLDAPRPGAWVECDLEVVGTGQTEAGDGVARYSGRCTRMGAG